MTKTFELKYGRKNIYFNISEKQSIKILKPKPKPKIINVEIALKEAMENCYGSRLDDLIKRNTKVLILTVDITRPSPKIFLDLIINFLKKIGAKFEIMIGLGMHRKMSYMEIKKHIGRDALQSNPNGLMWNNGETSFGTPIEVDTRLKEFDILIAVGFVEPSYLLGYTGGRKMIMPGVASGKAIAKNHFLLLSPGKKLGVLDGNPLSMDALEFAKAVNLNWIVDVVLNPDDTYAGIFCGDMEKANKEACKQCAEIYETPIDKKADVVIVSTGGYPYDIDLVQTKKGIVPAIECVKECGTIIFIGECKEGWGAEGIVSRKGLEEQKPKEILDELYHFFKQNKYPWNSAPCSSRYLFSKAVGELNCQLIGVTGINNDLKNTFVQTASSVNEALSMVNKEKADIIIIPDGRRVIPIL